MTSGLVSRSERVEPHGPTGVRDRLERYGSYGRMGQPVAHDGAKLVLVQAPLHFGDQSDGQPGLARCLISRTSRPRISRCVRCSGSPLGSAGPAPGR
jgi:hypothetical protein